MKTTKFLFLFLIGLLVMSFGALATTDDYTDNISSVTFTTPASGDWVQGTYTFSGTYVGNSSYNITVYNSSTYADPDTYGDDVLCSDSTVGTMNGTWSCSVATSSFVDTCTGRTIIAVGYNTTGQEGNPISGTNVTQATVKFDNTAPSTPSFSFTHATIKSLERNYFTCTSTDTCDSSLSWQVSLTDSKSSAKTNKTVATGDSAYFDKTDTKEQGTYTAYCSATDDAGNVITSSSATFKVDGNKNGVELISTRKSSKIFSSNNMMYFLLAGALVVVLMLIIMGGWYATQSKKVKKR